MTSSPEITSYPSASPDPDRVSLITEDVERFWQAFERSKPGFDPQVFDRLYLKPASPGLRDFLGRRIHGPSQLSAAVRRATAYYESIRPGTERLADFEPRIREIFRALEELYPEAVFPPVYFVVGRLNCGGARTDRGILIGAEMYGRTPDMPTEGLSPWHRRVIRPVEAIPQVVAHELIHFLQKGAGETPGLLFAVLREGAADFLAEKISGGHVSEAVHAWAGPREEALWREFRERLEDRDYSGWLYGGDAEDTVTGRPADLGYWMGYRIVEAYWRRARDRTPEGRWPEARRRAVGEILGLEEHGARDFLRTSGYPGDFG